METYLFVNTYDNSHTNGANRSYWSKFFKSVATELKESYKLKMHSSFNEDMPIFEYYSAIKNRFVRIMQFNPKNDTIESEIYSPSRFYTAWIGERRLAEEEMPKQELVVCLLMSRDNIKKAKGLIRAWLFESDEVSYSLIDEIYRAQDRMDDEFAKEAYKEAA